MLNLFSLPPAEAGREVTDALYSDGAVRIERIVSFNSVSDWYSQTEAEWVTLIAGEAELTFEDGITRLKEGDCIYIPPLKKHRVSYTSSPAIWLCVFILKE